MLAGASRICHPPFRLFRRPPPGKGARAAFILRGNQTAVCRLPIGIVPSVVAGSPLYAGSSILRTFPRLLAVVLGAVVLATAVTGSNAQRLFELLFGGRESEPRSAPPRTYGSAGHRHRSVLRPARRRVVAWPEPGRFAASGSAFCVRLCDSRYFPVEERATVFVPRESHAGVLRRFDRGGRRRGRPSLRGDRDRLPLPGAAGARLHLHRQGRCRACLDRCEAGPHARARRRHRHPERLCGVCGTGARDGATKRASRRSNATPRSLAPSATNSRSCRLRGRIE
jgi:hypothetical protein